jgi:dephospho-CoA kinase
MARIVFSDRNARAASDDHHQLFAQHFDAWFDALDPAALAVADIPLLYEVHREVDFDAVVVAACDAERSWRLVARDGLTEEKRVAGWPRAADRGRFAARTVVTPIARWKDRACDGDRVQVLRRRGWPVRRV